MAVVYLVQHGEAKSEQEDPARPLCEKGRWEVVKVAERLAKAGIKPSVIVHSGKLRAMQTADILANHLKPEGGIMEMQGLAPNDSPIMAAEYIKSAKGPVMLIGHLPSMGRISSLLIAGDENASIIAFRMAVVVCLEKEDRWRVRWILPPELA